MIRKNQALARAIRDAGLSYRTLAQLINLSPQTIFLLVNRRGDPQLSTMLKVSTALGKTMDELFAELGSNHRPTGTDPERGRVVSIRDAGRKGGKARAAKLTPEQRSVTIRTAANDAASYRRAA
jgi:DNA-binding XRE family transcriptional regulator